MDVRSQNLNLCPLVVCVTQLRLHVSPRPLLLSVDSLFPSILKSVAFTSVRLAHHASRSSVDFRPESDPECFRDHNLSTHLGFLAVVSWRRCRRKYCWNRLMSWWFQRRWHGNFRSPHQNSTSCHVPRLSRDGFAVLQVVFCGPICAQAIQTSYPPRVHLTKRLVPSSSH